MVFVVGFWGGFLSINNNIPPPSSQVLEQIDCIECQQHISHLGINEQTVSLIEDHSCKEKDNGFTPAI